MSEEMSKVTGLPEPETDKEEVSKMIKSVRVLALVFNSFFLIVGSGIASLVYFFGNTDGYDAKMDTLKAIDAQWAVLALIVFAFTVICLNTYPWQYKEPLKLKANLRSNMYIHQFATDKAGEGPAIVLHQEGDIGSYNRAHRSLHHMLENCLPSILSIPLLFYIYPLPAFITLVILCIGRMLHQHGYATGGYGQSIIGGHVPGFMLHQFTTYTLLGFLIVTYVNMVI